MLEIRLLAAEQTTRYTGGFDFPIFYFQKHGPAVPKTAPFSI